ncbi:MAG: hypothetical protein AAB966_03780 [Patescibacteria group bacterium]
MAKKKGSSGVVTRQTAYLMMALVAVVLIATFFYILGQMQVGTGY